MSYPSGLLLRVPRSVPLHINPVDRWIVPIVRVGIEFL